MCVLSKMVFWNNGRKGYCIISKCWVKKRGIGKEVMQKNCSSLRTVKRQVGSLQYAFVWVCGN